jgi:ubiquinone/menaquinone biosynthesis C-methylase UbiE
VRTALGTFVNIERDVRHSMGRRPKEHPVVMTAQALRTLDDSQLQTFAHYDYVSDVLFAGITEAIDRDFLDGEFSILDVGGGCGYFADRILEHFPKARLTLLDNSDLLLSQNKTHSRKTLVFGSATEMIAHFRDRSFDLVFFNLSLHHFVTSGYAETRKMQRDALKQAIMVLSPRGRVVVTENLFDGFVIDNLPGRLIYALTSSKLLAPVVKRLGSNTAGCGVCFNSARAWRKEFGRSGLSELAFVGDRQQEYTLWAKLRLYLLGMQYVNRAFFWLSRSSCG